MASPVSGGAHAGVLCIQLSGEGGFALGDADVCVAVVPPCHSLEFVYCGHVCWYMRRFNLDTILDLIWIWIRFEYDLHMDTIGIRFGYDLIRFGYDLDMDTIWI